MAIRQWEYRMKRSGAKPSDAEKKTVSITCERFIKEVLKPRFLPEIRPTEFNYCTDIFGKWHGKNYRFLQQFRNDHPEKYVQPEFTQAFARLEYVGPDRFDLSYFRHTGQWWTVDRGASLEQALQLLETSPYYHPIV